MTSHLSKAFDLGNPKGTECFSGCVHIFNKQAVAHRLSLASRAIAYNASGVVYSGPRVGSVVLQGGGAAAALLVTYVGPGVEGGGLKLRSTYGFEVCAKGCNATLKENSPNIYSNKSQGKGFAPAMVVGSSKNTVRLGYCCVLFWRDSLLMLVLV